MSEYKKNYEEILKKLLWDDGFWNNALEIYSKYGDDMMTFDVKCFEKLARAIEHGDEVYEDVAVVKTRNDSEYYLNSDTLEKIMDEDHSLFRIMCQDIDRAGESTDLLFLTPEQIEEMWNEM